MKNNHIVQYRFAIFAALVILCLFSNRAQGQYIGQTVDNCASDWVDSSNYVEQTTCLSGDQNGLNAYVDTEDEGYQYIGGDSLFVVGVMSDAQVLDPSWSVVYDSGMGNGSGTFTPQLDTMYQLQGLYDECYDPSGGSDWQLCYWQGPMDGVNVSAEVTGPPAVLDPAYKITSIIYAPPGNKSSAGYSSSTTNGSTTSLGSSLQASQSITFGQSFWGFFKSSESFGAIQSTSDSSAFQEQFSNATSVSNQSQSTNPNAIDHRQDLFLIWLNPEITFPMINNAPVSYGISTQMSNAQQQPVDIVEVTASTRNDRL